MRTFQSSMHRLTASVRSAVIIIAGLASIHAAEVTDLLDKDLSQFEIWIGVPHTTVEGLSPGTPTSNSVTKGTPLGLNNDPKQVFTVIEEEGELVLAISGEIYGGISTIEEYSNYHFSTLFKWGDKKWAPRLTKLRDSGLLYHCHGKHGAFWNVWKACLEYQVQETDLGDLFCLAGTSADVRSTRTKGIKKPRYDSMSDTYSTGGAYAFPEPDKPHGEWNLLEIYTIGTTAVHVVNGHVVMVAENTRNKSGPLSHGQIQIQSEGATCYYKQLHLQPITEFPESIASAIRLQGSGD